MTATIRTEFNQKAGSVNSNRKVGPRWSVKDVGTRVGTTVTTLHGMSINRSDPRLAKGNKHSKHSTGNRGRSYAFFLLVSRSIRTCRPVEIFRNENHVITTMLGGLDFVIFNIRHVSNSDNLTSKRALVRNTLDNMTPTSTSPSHTFNAKPQQPNDQSQAHRHAKQSK
jgi:hypothetical protein